MMFERTSLDQTALDAMLDALLTYAKQQARVEHDRDDDLIRGYCEEVLALVEQVCSINLRPCTYTSVPSSPPGSWVAWGWPQERSGVWRSPFNNLRDLRALDDAAQPVLGWSFTQEEFGGSATAYLIGPSSAAPGSVATFEIDCGVDDVADLSPLHRQALGRLVAAKYELREANLSLTPDLYLDELAPLRRMLV